MLIQEGKHALLLVGDERQSIYQWRGAVNMMSRLRQSIEEGKIAGEIRHLTESFRYGPRTADLATRILSLGSKQAPTITGRGIDNPQSDGGHCCYLSRTNAGPIDAALSTVENHRGGTVHFAATRAPDWSPRLAYKFDFIRSVYGHFAGQPYLVTDPEIKRFVDWNDILRHGTSMDASKNEAVDQELAAAIKFVTKYTSATPQMLDRIEASCDSPEYAVASFSTAHRAKGLEWERVTLLNDFPRLDDDNKTPDVQELNLLYVALTRGKHWVQLNADLSSFFARKSA